MNEPVKMDSRDIPGCYVVDAGDPVYSAELPQPVVDENGDGLIHFTVPDRERDPSTSLVISFDGSLDWIEPEITADHRLVQLTLLSTSWHIGRGQIVSQLVRVGPREDAGNSTPYEKWKVTIEPSSIEGPPVLQDDDLSQGVAKTGTSRRGLVEATIDYGLDDRVLGVELVISRRPGPQRDT